MLINLLRIFITKSTINRAVSEHKKIMAEQKAQEQIPLNITNLEEAKAYLKQREEQVRFCSRPVMALERAANGKIFFPIMILFGIFICGASFGLIVSELFNERNIGNIMLGVLAIVATISLLVFCKYCMHYWKNTMCLYYQKKICIKQYRKEDVEITYDEVKECIHKRKIRVRNGRFEYPYNDGYIHVYTWGNSVKDGFYKFMHDKCVVKMPVIGEKERAIVRKNGIGWGFYTYLGLPLLVISGFFMFVGCISDFGLNFSVDFWKTYISYCFNWTNVFTLLGMFFLILGVILKVVFYFPAKKYFKKYEDVVEVKLF